ncbi:hypothetical protein AQUCO_00200998v1 [Aquilegia coerulea]|nr:hypothetical protein AQUCO_00200998v1 [Aquilegia coerulea]
MLFAVKLVHKHLTDKLVSKQFLAEVGTMGRTYHRNLVRVYGYCFHESMKALVYEYMEKGSLDKLLKDTTLEWRKVYNIVTDTAKGLSYLHENCHHRIIHLDIKPANVLIDSDFSSKIADYGLAKKYKWSLSHVTLTKLEGTYGYIAPELCLNFSSRGNSKCDVYSFGMLLFKVLESKKKGENQRWFPAEVYKKFKEGELEEFLNECAIEEIDRKDAMKLVSVALCCIQNNPQDRPSMSTVVKTLEGDIQARVPPNLLLPHMFSSGVASMTSAEENKYKPPSINSSLSITKDGDYTTERSTSFKFPVPSEISPAFAKHIPVELECPVQKPRIETEKKNQENKDIKPEVKKDEVTTVILRVGMHCEDCAQKIKKNLVKMEGVLSADADQGNSLVTVKCVIDPNKLVDCIWKKNKKRAHIVETEPEKKQEEKDGEQGKKNEDRKEEGVDILKFKFKKEKEELDTVKSKSEGKGAAEIELMKKDEAIRIITNQEKEEKAKAKAKVELKREDKEKIDEKQGIGETEQLREDQERIREEQRKTKTKKKKEENLGSVETRSEGSAVEIKLKKRVEESGIAKTVQEKEEKAIAELKGGQEGSREEKRRRKADKKSEEELGRVIKEEKGAGETELKRKGQKRIKERRVSRKINPEKEEQEEEEHFIDNKTEESRGVEMIRQTEGKTEEAKQVEEELTYLRAKMQNDYYLQILNDQNSYSCTIL